MSLGQKGFTLIEGLLTITAFLLIGAGGYWIYSNNSNSKLSQQEITNYEECAAAGYPIQESYPEKCSVPDGGTYTRELTGDEKNNLDETDEQSSLTFENEFFALTYPSSWSAKDTSSVNGVCIVSPEYSSEADNRGYTDCALKKPDGYTVLIVTAQTTDKDIKDVRGYNGVTYYDEFEFQDSIVGEKFLIEYTDEDFTTDGIMLRIPRDNGGWIEVIYTYEKGNLDNYPFLTQEIINSIIVK